MKTNFLFICFISLIFFSCNKHYPAMEEAPKDILENNIEPVSLQSKTVFSGSILGNKISVILGEKGWEKLNSGLQFQLKFVDGDILPKPTNLMITLGLHSKEQGINIVLPTMTLEQYNDINFIRQQLKVGNKFFSENPTLFFTGQDKDMNNRYFTFRYTFAVSATEGITLTTAWGNQDNSSIEIIDLKETINKNLITGETTSSFKILFKIDKCKLYTSKGELRGEAKNVFFVSDFDYAPYNR